MINKDWSCALEDEIYENNINLLIKDSIKAVSETGKGNYVNLVTHSSHGNPENYLVSILIKECGEDHIACRYVSQCGCGGYVLKVIV